MSLQLIGGLLIKNIDNTLTFFLHLKLHFVNNSLRNKFLFTEFLLCLSNQGSFKKMSDIQYQVDM